MVLPRGWWHAVRPTPGSVAISVAIRAEHVDERTTTRRSYGSDLPAPGSLKLRRTSMTGGVPQRHQHDGHAPDATGLVFYYALCDKQLAERCLLLYPHLEGRVIRWHTGGTLLGFATATALEWGLDERHASTVAPWMADFQHKPALGGVVLADTRADPRPGPPAAPPAPLMERLLGATVGTLVLLNQGRLRPGTSALSAQETAGNAEADPAGDGDAQTDWPAKRGEADGSSETGHAPDVPHEENATLPLPQLGPSPTESGPLELHELGQAITMPTQVGDSVAARQASFTQTWYRAKIAHVRAHGDRAVHTVQSARMEHSRPRFPFHGSGASYRPADPSPMKRHRRSPFLFSRRVRGNRAKRRNSRTPNKGAPLTKDLTKLPS